jgi:hypothetical protein
MANRQRDVGLEILEGLRQLKRGEHDRIINVRAVRGREAAALFYYLNRTLQRAVPEQSALRFQRAVRTVRPHQLPARFLAVS